MPTNEANPLDDAAIAAILDAGERLLAALNDEQRLSEAYPKDIAEVFTYLETVSRARKNVDECAEKYREILAKYDFPDVPIRHTIESEENRVRWDLPPLTS